MSKPSIVFRRIPRTLEPTIPLAKECSVADLSESLHRAEGPVQLMDARIRPINTGLRIAGPAITALNYPGDNTMIHAALEVAEAGDILVMSSGGSAQGPLWGDMICSYAIAKQISGVIIDGSTRDSEFMIEQRFPVWSAAVSASHPEKRNPGSVNVPVICGGVLVHPGDLIVADSDGVICVPRLRAEQVLAAARERNEKEREIRRRVNQGESLYDLLNYGSLLSELGVETVDSSWEEQ